MERQCLTPPAVRCKVCDAPADRRPVKYHQIKIVGGDTYAENTCIECVVLFVWKYLPVYVTDLERV